MKGEIATRHWFGFNLRTFNVVLLVVGLVVVVSLRLGLGLLFWAAVFAAFGALAVTWFATRAFVRSVIGRFTLVDAAAVTLVLATLSLLVVLGVQWARRSARETACQNDIVFGS